MQKKYSAVCALCALAVTAFTSVSASELTGEELAKRQARSVHLYYGPEVQNAIAAQGTVTVTETQTNSYYMVLGWSTGYCGIQDWGSHKVFIFSVWEPSDPYDFKAKADDVKEEIRAKVLYSGEGVNVSRFGGEGTGAKTLTDINWQVGKGVTARIESAPDGADRTAYTCYIHLEQDGTSQECLSSWRKIATISTLNNPSRKPGISGVHSFVEDFWRNTHSATIARRAEFSNVKCLAAGETTWREMTTACFTADPTPSNAIDAGRIGPKSFFLKTGGGTENKNAQLWKWID